MSSVECPRTNEFNFGDDPDHRPDPGVRNPDSLDSGASSLTTIFVLFVSTRK